MEFLTTKGEDNPSGRITIDEIKSALKIADFIDKLDSLNIDLLEIKDSLKDKNDYLKFREILKDTICIKDIFTIGNPININYLPFIEKDKAIPEGTLYRNSVNDILRVKTKNGWKTIKTE